MSNAIKQLKNKAERHLLKIIKHNEVLDALESELSTLEKYESKSNLSASEKAKKTKVERQIQITKESIVYHKTTVKTYNKAIDIVKNN